MPVAIQEAAVDSRSTLLAESSGPRPILRPEFVLPIMARSAVLLNLLLQDNAIDLGLASSVVALDAGLAFGVLQLANPVCGEGADPVWQLPAALVAAGRESLQDLLECAPRLEAQSDRHGKDAALMRDSVVRACVAQLLARQLGKCNSKKAYLGGLLMDIPRMVAATRKMPDGYRARLLSIMCSSLPAALVRAAMTEVDEGAGVSDPLMATILLAELQLRDTAELEASEFWGSWPDRSSEQRCCLLESCRDLSRWAGENVIRLDPWEFMVRLERQEAVVSGQ